jgi:hypothetical protein
MWPFKKKKTPEETLTEILAKVDEIIRWMHRNESYPPVVVEGVRQILTECTRLEKELEEEAEFYQRYYHK